MDKFIAIATVAVAIVAKAIIIGKAMEKRRHKSMDNNICYRKFGRQKAIWIVIEKSQILLLQYLKN